VTITAGVGEKFPTRTNFRSRDNWLAEWRLVGVTGDAPLSKDFRRSNLVMASDVTLPASGAFLGVATVTAQTIEMKGQEFTDYLKEEGLENIIAAAKIALRNGPGPALHLTRAAGLRAEFIPATDPTMIRTGGTLTVQLLAEGKPVSGAQVSAVSGEKPVSAQTDKDGRVTFTIDRSGAWLIKTVHMVRLSQPTEAEWESYWVTLAFHTAS